MAHNMEESKDQLSTSASSANSGSVQGEKDDALSTLPESDAETQAATTPSTEEDWVTGPRLWFILSGVSLVLFMMLLDVSIISTAIPKITSNFHSLANVGWYGAAYQLSTAALLPLTGKIYENFSLKWTFLVFLFIFELGSLLCAVSTSANMLIVARSIAGMGASGLQNGGISVITNVTPMRKRPAVLGMVMGLGQLGIVGGPLIGGLFTQFVTWRWCFYINLPLGGLAAFLIVLMRIPERVAKPPPLTVLKNLHHKLDLIGFALFAPTMVMLLLALQWGGNTYPWNSATVIGLFCGSGAMFLIWLSWDYYKGANAMIPLPVLRKRSVWSSVLLQGCLGAGLFMLSYYMPIYFQSVRGKSPAISGVFLLPSILAQLVGTVTAGKLVSKFGFYVPWMLASGVLMSVGYGLLSTLKPNTSAIWILYQIIAGVGRGIGFQMPIIAVQRAVTPAQIPVGMAMTMFGQTLTGALFLSFADTLFTNSLRTLIPEDAPGVDVDRVIAAGAYNIRGILSGSALSGVLKAYSQSIDRVFYMCAGLGVCYFCFAWFTGWVDIRKEGQQQQQQKKADVAATEP